MTRHRGALEKVAEAIDDAGCIPATSVGSTKTSTPDLTLELTLDLTPGKMPCCAGGH